MSSGHRRIKWRRNIAENFNRLSRVHERYRQTTDGRTTTYSEHEHEFKITIIRKVTVVVVHDVHSPVYVQKEHRPRQRPTLASLVRLLGRDRVQKGAMNLRSLFTL